MIFFRCCYLITPSRSCRCCAAYLKVQDFVGVLLMTSRNCRSSGLPRSRGGESNNRGSLSREALRWGTRRFKRSRGRFRAHPHVFGDRQSRGHTVCRLPSPMTASNGRMSRRGRPQPAPQRPRPTRVQQLMSTAIGAQLRTARYGPRVPRRRRMIGRPMELVSRSRYLQRDQGPVEGNAAIQILSIAERPVPLCGAGSRGLKKLAV